MICTSHRYLCCTVKRFYFISVETVSFQHWNFISVKIFPSVCNCELFTDKSLQNNIVRSFVSKQQTRTHRHLLAFIFVYAYLCVRACVYVEFDRATCLSISLLSCTVCLEMEMRCKFRVIIENVFSSSSYRNYPTF